jgi:hypothetical protein
VFLSSAPDFHLRNLQDMWVYGVDTSSPEDPFKFIIAFKSIMSYGDETVEGWY